MMGLLGRNLVFFFPPAVGKPSGGKRERQFHWLMCAYHPLLFVCLNRCSRRVKIVDTAIAGTESVKLLMLRWVLYQT